MELISRISKGTLMDQVYLPKIRPPWFAIGDYVALRPVAEAKEIKPYFYNVSNLEPIKSMITQDILAEFEHAENVIITGSFLDKGMDFNDIDIIAIVNQPFSIAKIEESLKKKWGITPHIMSMSYKTLLKGLSTDPLFQVMLSRFAAKKRLIFKIKKEMNYKLLDLHLLKGRLLIDTFEELPGREKYKLLRNTIAIKLFIEDKTITSATIDKAIENTLSIKVNMLKENLMQKEPFLQKYKKLHNGLFNKIMEGIKHSQQK